MNKLIVIGWLGDRRVYFNIPREEAIERWAITDGQSLTEAEEYITNHDLIAEVTFDDEFWAYDIGNSK